MGPVLVQWSLEAAGVGPEAGPVAGPAAGEAEVVVPGPHSRLHQSSGSGCEVEAVAAAAGGMKGGEGRGRSLLTRLLMDCPAVAEGVQRRAGLDSGQGVVNVAE